MSLVLLHVFRRFVLSFTKITTPFSQKPHRDEQQTLHDHCKTDKKAFKTMQVKKRWILCSYTSRAARRLSLDRLRTQQADWFCYDTEADWQTEQTIWILVMVSQWHKASLHFLWSKVPPCGMGGSIALKDETGNLRCWQLLLSELEFHVVHCPGIKHHVTDALW